MMSFVSSLIVFLVCPSCGDNSSINFALFGDATPTFTSLGCGMAGLESVAPGEEEMSLQEKLFYIACINQCENQRFMPKEDTLSKRERTVRTS